MSAVRYSDKDARDLRRRRKALHMRSEGKVIDFLQQVKCPPEFSPSCHTRLILCAKLTNKRRR